MKTFRTVAVSMAVAGMLALTTGARAEGLITFRFMSPELALELAQAALASCRDEDFQVAVAVVDRFGTVQVILRDQFAGPHTSDTARRKAYTAVSFRTDTLSLAEETRAGAENSGVRFVTDVLMLGGGVPVEAGGSIVGGIGVSGAPSGAADDTCAREGIDTVLDKIEF